MMLRAFIALTPPASVQHTVTTIQEDFAPLNLAWRWVRPAQVHLTLRFLGDVPETRVAALAAAMTQAAEGQAAFALRVQSLGCFPHASRPSVLWLGLDDPDQVLVRLQARLTTALIPLGIPPEDKPFRPHLTLARAQNRIRSRQLLPMLQTYHMRHFGEFLVTQLHLYHSQLQRGGPLYTILQSVSLQS